MLLIWTSDCPVERCRFLFFGLATNIIVSSKYIHLDLGQIENINHSTDFDLPAMLILGGSATVTDLTGMNTVAACFLIPLGVSIVSDRVDRDSR